MKSELSKNVRGKMIRFVTMASAISLCVGGMAFAEPALDNATGLTAGMLTTLRVTSEVPTTITGYIRTSWGTGSGDTKSWNVYWSQPKLELKNAAGTWNVFGVCVDPIREVGSGVTYTNNYTVGAYASGASKIESDTAWNKLTSMWSQATITSDLDRAAIQLATWKGCAGDFDASRASSLGAFWTTGDGDSSSSNFTFTVSDYIGHAGVLDRASEYLALAGNGSVAAPGYMMITSPSYQNFAISSPPPVPEPGTIVAALSVLAPAGMMFRRKRK